MLKLLWILVRLRQIGNNLSNHLLMFYYFRNPDADSRRIVFCKVIATDVITFTYKSLVVRGIWLVFTSSSVSLYC